MDNMQQIKQVVASTLERRGTLAQLRAQLRAQVFLAIDEHEQDSTGAGIGAKTNSPAREALLKDPQGLLLVSLVDEFLESCTLNFTKLVFDPEMGAELEDVNRHTLASKVGLSSAEPGVPLLLTILKAFLSPGSMSASPVPGNKLPGLSTHLLSPQKPAALDPIDTSSSKSLFPRHDPSSSVPPPSQAAAKPAALPTAQSPPRNESAKVAPAPVPAPAVKASAPEPQPVPTAAKIAPVVIKAVPQPAPQKPTPASAPAQEVSEDFDEDIEIESDDELAGAEIIDDDEDYASAMGLKPAQPAPAKPSPALPQPAPAAKPAGPAPMPSPAPTFTPGPLAEPSDISETGSVLAPGRIRPSKLRQSSDSTDIMAGDRSLGVSHELGNYGGLSGGLSMSSELYSPDDAHKPYGLPLASPTSTDSVSLGAAKLGKLEPLGPVKPLASKLAPLAPIGAKTSPLASPLQASSLPSSLTSSKEDPLLKGSGPRRDSEKEKEDLRRMGLLTSDSGLSMELDSLAPPAMGRPPMPALNLGAVRSNIAPPRNVYDAELSVTQSIEYPPEAPAEIVEEELSNVSSATPDEHEESSRSISQPAAPNRLGFSMDLRETGLSASDRSGDIDHLFSGVDLAETAEWH